MTGRRPEHRARRGAVATRHRLLAALRWPVETDGDRNTAGLARSRPTVNWTLRLMGRAYLATTNDRRTGAPRSLPLVGAFAAGDVALSRWLGRTTGTWLVPRLIVDAADHAFWAARTADADRVVLIGCPLATEVAIGHGAWGLGVPALNYSVMWAVRRRAGMATPASAMTAQLAAVGIGVMLSWFGRRHDRDGVRRSQADVDAQRTASFVAGQNRVAAGADSVVDLIARTEPLLIALERDGGAVEPSGTARALHTWKADLATVTAEHAAYLGTVLRAWERSQQSADLQGDVILDFPPDVGTTVVTDAQAQSLRTALERLGLAGSFRLDIVEPIDARRPGRRFTVTVDGTRIGVPDDPAGVPPVFDPIPLMIVAGATSIATTVLPSLGGTPWWVAAAEVGVSLAFAVWVNERGKRGRPLAPSTLIDVLLATHTVMASIIVLTRRHERGPGGRRLLPQADGHLISAMLIAGFVADGPDRQPGGAVVAKALLCSAPALHLAGALRPSTYRTGPLAPVAAYFGTRGMAAHAASRREELLTEYERRAAAAREAGFDAGRRSVLDLVAAACADAARRLEALDRRRSSAGTVDERVLSEAAARQAEAARQLRSLAAGVPGAASGYGTHPEPAGGPRRAIADLSSRTGRP